MASFTFLYPQWFAALLPLALLLPWLTQRKQKQGLIAPHLAEKLGINRLSKQRSILPWLSVLWLLAVIALAGPSWQKTTLPAYSLSGARVLVMDMSRSMYATDVKPNRLAQARFKALDLLPGWKEGSTGLVTYAADGYIVSPLTRDSKTLATLIPHLSPEIMPIQGSNAAAGIQQAIDLLKQAGHTQGDIILITDGLSEKESAQSQELLADTHYRLSILAVGTTQGAPIQLPDGKLLTNSEGKTVIAKVDLDTLLPLTKETGGQLQLAQSTNRDVDSLIAATAKPFNSSSKQDQKELEERLNNGFWLLIPVIIIALFGFRRGVLLALLITITPVDSVHAASWKEPFRNDDTVGFELFEQGQFAEAAKHFNSPAWKGAAEYKAGEYEQSIETLRPLKDARSKYNLANAYAQNKQFDQAEALYQELLANDPNNPDIKRNLDVIKKVKEQQKQQDKKQQQSGDKSQKDQQQQQSGDKSQKDQQQQQSGDKSQQDQQQQQSGDKSQKDQQQQQSGDKSQKDQQQQQSGDKSQKDQQQQQSGGKSQQDQQQQQSGGKSQQDQQQQQPGDKSQQNQQQQQSGEQPPQDQAQLQTSTTESGISASDPVLKKLEQVPDDTSGLIRAQLILQARQKSAPKATENSW